MYYRYGTFRIDQQSLDNFVKELRSLGHIISDPNMQLYRANRFREYTKKMVQSGMLDLKPLTELTQIISGSPHKPLYMDGSLIDHMGVKPVGKNAAEAGYWEGNTTKVPDKNITYAHLATIMHTGYRIPLQGDKGMRVRAWFWHQHKIRFSQTKSWLVVPPRPFVWMSWHRYDANGEDVIAVNEFLAKLANSPIDTTKRRKSVNV